VQQHQICFGIFHPQNYAPENQIEDIEWKGCAYYCTVLLVSFTNLSDREGTKKVKHLSFLEMEFVGVSKLGDNQVDQKDQVENQKAVEIDVCDPLSHPGISHKVVIIVFDWRSEQSKHSCPNACELRYVVWKQDHSNNAVDEHNCQVEQNEGEQLKHQQAHDLVKRAE